MAPAQNKPFRLHSLIAPWSAFLFLVDLITTVGSAVLAAVALELLLGHEAEYWPLSERAYLLVLVVSLSFILLMQWAGAYLPWRGRGLAEELRRVSLCWLATFILFASFAFWSKTGFLFSRLWVGVWFAQTWLAMLLLRGVLRRSLAWIRRQGWDTKEILIIGDGDLAMRAAQSISSSPGMGFHVQGYFAADGQRSQVLGLAYLGTPDQLERYLHEHEVHQCWIALPFSEQALIQSLASLLDQHSLEVKLVPDIFGFQLMNHSVESVASLPLIKLNSSPQLGLDALAKRFIDVGGALFALLLFAPLMIVIGLLVRFSSPGPVLYRQQRHGWNGKPFEMYKFRTMTVAQGNDGTFEQARRNDSRVTPIGAILRRTSMDELPQLFNVLQGQMSLVGPRPHAVEMNRDLQGRVYRYMARHKVRPGMTGWAQVNGYRGETDTDEKIEGRVEHDLYYIEHWSLLLDIKILFKTLFVGFKHPNAY